MLSYQAYCDRSVTTGKVNVTCFIYNICYMQCRDAICSHYIKPPAVVVVFTATTAMTDMTDIAT